MAEFIPLAELALRIAMLPPISRGVHLAGPILHARRLIELWKGDGDDGVSLMEAFRLLDAEAVDGALMRTGMKMADEGFEFGDARHWAFPDFEAALPELRATAWEWMSTGRLQVEAKKDIRAKQHREVLPAELARLAPDWELSRLMRAGIDELIDVRVRHAPAEPIQAAEPIQGAWRKPKRAELQAAALAIAQRCEPGVRLSQADFWTRMKAQMGRPDLTRQQARTALDDYAPQLKIQPGYHTLS